MADELSAYPTTVASDDGGSQPHLIITPGYEDPNTGALFIHRDLVAVRDDWATEAHIGPVTANEAFADAASWAAYVKTHEPAGADNTLYLTWNASGLRAVLDYHGVEAGRCGHIARQPFVLSTEWNAWAAFANGMARRQVECIDRLEDLAEDITEPAQADIIAILRSLRANVTAKASSDIRPDGTATLAFEKDASVSGKGGTVEIPGTIAIAIPVLHGDTDKWGVKVRLRVSVDDSTGRLAFRFSLINADRVLEAVYAERVAQARDELGEGYAILRAAD